MSMKKFHLKSPLANIRALYDSFNASVTALDCGQECSQHNPSGKPFCCDICHAVPAAYRQEWDYLHQNTDMWHTWRGDECPDGPHLQLLQAEAPKEMVLLACLGPQACQRPFRALSCRQFPFFPYVTSDYRFVGLAYEWEFEPVCWVISNLEQVTEDYRREFIETHDRLFALEQEIFENYAYHSERMRAHFSRERRRLPLLHRNGGFYLVSPASERMARVSAEKLPKFSEYRPEGFPG